MTQLLDNTITMDPNTLNLKNTAVPTSNTIPTVQAGSPLQGSIPQAPAQNMSSLPPITKEEEAILDDTQRELRTRFELLPKELQDTIISSDYQMKLFELAKKYRLFYEELGQLELETTMVLLGITKPEEFAESLGEAIKKDMATTITPLTKEIDAQVFASIRPQLAALYAISETPREEIATQQQNVPLSQELASKPPITMAGATPIAIQFNQTPQPAPVTPVTTPGTTVAPVLEKHEDDALKSSGIEISATPFNTDTHKDSFTSKLTSVFGVKSTATDHTLPKITGDTSTTKAPTVDPYREIV